MSIFTYDMVLAEKVKSLQALTPKDLKHGMITITQLHCAAEIWGIPKHEAEIRLNKGILPNDEDIQKACSKTNPRG